MGKKPVGLQPPYVFPYKDDLPSFFRNRNVSFLNADTLLQGALYILTERENMRITHVRLHGQQQGEAILRFLSLQRKSLCGPERGGLRKKMPKLWENPFISTEGK